MTKKRIVVCLEVYFVIYILKIPIYYKNHDNIIVSWEENQLILKILEGWANLGGAEFLHIRVFLGFFFAKYLPLTLSTSLQGNMKFIGALFTWSRFDCPKIFKF